MQSERYRFLNCFNIRHPPLERHGVQKGDSIDIDAHVRSQLWHAFSAWHYARVERSLGNIYPGLDFVSTVTRPSGKIPAFRHVSRHSPWRDLKT